MTLRQIFAVCTLLLLSVVPEKVSAMHIIGGEITYECLGDAPNNAKRYRFTMKIYRDCNGNGAGFDNPAQIAIYRGTEFINVRIDNFQASGPVITTLQPVPPDCVSEIPDVCVQQAIYTFERNLPVLQNPTESYFIVYQRCCRNLTINNLINPGDIGATYMIDLTYDAQQACNDSPVFNNFPPIIICKDFYLEFDHSATDAEGDQLVYSFCSPL
jgi:hypothetical protein